MSPALTLLFDLLLVGLLGTAIVYMVLINRRLGRLRDVKADFERVLAGFGEAATKAEASIARLKSAGQEAGRLDRQDRARLDRVQSLRDDLAFLLERGTQLADRLEGSVRQARDGAAGEAPVASLDRPRAGAGAAPRSPAPASATEQALIDALRHAR